MAADQYKVALLFVTDTVFSFEANSWSREMEENGLGGIAGSNNRESDGEGKQFFNDLTLVMKELHPRVRLLRRRSRLQLLEDTKANVLRNWSEYRVKYSGYSISTLRFFVDRVFQFQELVFIERCRKLRTTLERLIEHTPWPSANDLDEIKTNIDEDFVERVVQIMDQESDSIKRMVELMLSGTSQEQVCIQCGLASKDVRNSILAFWERVESELLELARTLNRDKQISLEHQGESGRENLYVAKRLILCSYEEQQALFEKAELLIEHGVENTEDQAYLREVLNSIKETLVDAVSISVKQLTKLIGCLREVNSSVYRLIKDETG